jgi:formylglycine-generating enzyme required for sulfatase activity
MGVVYRARDAALSREVAVKVLADHYGPDSPHAERFLTEARITAQLQHPGIPAVHQVGALLDGRPFLAMKLIKGQTLDEVLEGRPDRGRLLAVFEAICQAVGYAHAHEVIHRDLKPSNVMVGAFGEVQVMDWGLAKVLREVTLVTAAPQAPEPTRAWTEVSRPPGAGSHTQAGSLIGTPAFIPPEQAIGQIERVDKRSDVFGLGALLAVILTGKPPYVGETPDSVRVMAVRGKLEDCFARLDASGAEPELVALCKKCLAFEPADRPADAAAVAEAVAAFRAAADERARRAELERVRMQGEQATADARAAEWRKRRRLWIGAAAAVVLALAVGTMVSYLKYLEARQEAEKAERAREFLVSIFKISEKGVQGGNITARKILADAETRIPVEFAGQPELRAELEAAIDKVKRGLGRKVPQAMILEVRGPVQLQSATGVSKGAVPQALVNLDDRLTLSPDAQVQLVFLSDLHKERLKPGRTVSVDWKGCEPADAILERDSSILMTFVRLPKGTFYMGWDDKYKKKGKKTEIKEDFEIAVHTVTQGQWEAVMGDNPSHHSPQRAGAGKDISDEELKLFPVDNVSWDDAQAFIKKLNEKERRRGYLYRLPTEAEWEYACRGGATSEEECSYHFYFDKPTNDLSSEQANFNGDAPFGKAPQGKNLQRATRVGAYPPNKLGLFDMHGNVWQWCVDPFQEGSDRVLRGGSWYDRGTTCRVGSRHNHPPTYRSSHNGFRLVRVAVR